MTVIYKLQENLHHLPAYCPYAFKAGTQSA